MRIILSRSGLPCRLLPRPAFARPLLVLGVFSVFGLGILGLGAAGSTPSLAQSEPPIRSAEDAFCRSEARAQVFSAPDPLNLGLREIGRRIWASCMERTANGKKQNKKQKPHKRRRHR